MLESFKRKVSIEVAPAFVSNIEEKCAPKSGQILREMITKFLTGGFSAATERMLVRL